MGYQAVARDQAKAAGAQKSPEAFANVLADGLNDEYRRGSFERRIENIGLGIHFTAYELIDGRRIPELFVVTNWRETWPTPYSALSPEGFAVTRETWKTILRTIGC